MRFEERLVSDSEGWALAHSVVGGSRRISKGTVLSPSLISQLTNAGVERAQVFLLETGDLDEDTATEAAAAKITGYGLKIKPAGKGRANIVAACDGLFVPGDCIDTINSADDAFSAASLASHAPVRAGQLVATIKLVPYGLPAAKLDNIQTPSAQMTVKPFQQFNAVLIATGDAPTPKAIASLTSRVDRVGGLLQIQETIEHNQKTVGNALLETQATQPDLILMLGASAISDKRDVFPAALTSVGGELIKLGMPADPGNLLMLGKLGGTTVIGLPGCARSPALNGFDWVLERFAAKEPLNAQTLTEMGTGGLLKEPAGRKTPRAEVPPATAITSTAVVLAAGKSSRSKNIHKLLSILGNKTVIATTIDMLQGIKNLKVLVVTGHKAAEIDTCFSDIPVTTVHNPHFEQGMGTSLAVGIGALDEATDYALVCLGDMPFVQQTTVEKMIEVAAKTNGAAVLIPTFHGKRGHPVLWHKRFFSALENLHGDTGGRQILEQNPEKIIEVPVDDAGILIDLDTPEMLAQFGVIPTDQ